MRITQVFDKVVQVGISVLKAVCYVRDSIKMRMLQRQYAKQNIPKHWRAYGLYLDYEKHFIC